MNYQAVCTFDIQGASPSDYDDAFVALERLGFKRPSTEELVVEGAHPSNSVLGTYASCNAGFLRTCLWLKVKEAFARMERETDFRIIVAGAEPARAGGRVSRTTSSSDIVAASWR